MSSAVNLTVYNKKYSDDFFTAGFTDTRSILLDSRLNFYLLKNAFQSTMFYKVSNERTPTLEVIFLKVPQGQGNYIYLGDLNQNGIQDENEFQLVNFDGEYIKIVTPTEQTFPTTSVQTSVTFSVNPGRYLEAKKGSFLDILLDGLNLETYIAVDEKSKDPVQSNIYLLKISHFQNEVNTLNGVNIFRQDINLFENYEYAGVRLRYNQRKGFAQYFTGNERTLYIERSARLNLSFTEDLIFVNEYINESDRNNAPLGSFRNRNIIMNSYVSDLTYEPFKNVQVGFGLRVSRAKDTYQLPNVQSDQNNQLLRFNYGLGNKGKVRLEIERSEVILNNEPLYLPYEMTKGKPVGKGFFWTLGLDYRLTDFIQATVNYFGRAEGKSRVIHTGTAEFRAFF
jgi:hypothetical protein